MTIFSRKGSIDNDDVIHDEDNGHKDNDHDNPVDYVKNDNFVINIIITNDDDDVDGVFYDDDDHDDNDDGRVYDKKNKH